MNKTAQQTVGICGAGVMGRGIAVATLIAGKKIRLYDTRQEVLDSAMDYIDKQLKKAVEKEKITAKDAKSMLTGCKASTDLSAMSACGMVIEAIVEKQDIKAELFAALEELLPEDAIIATNTSSISISLLSRTLKHPERFIGLHFFNPAHIMKLIEIIRGSKTSDATVETVQEFANLLGKTAVMAKDVPGFIVNRVARNFYNEALRIVGENAADAETVDYLIRGMGFKMGPFELMDLIGVDTNLDVTESMWQQYYYEPRFAPSSYQKELVLAGKHGKKSGEGFYKYDAEGNIIRTR